MCQGLLNNFSAKSVDVDQTAPQEQSDQCLHYLLTNTLYEHCGKHKTFVCLNLFEVRYIK